MRLTAQDLMIERGGRIVAGPLSFAVEPGRALVLTGPNGSGKTSLLRVLAGLVRPAAGHLELSGGDQEATVSEQAHYIGHANAVKPQLTAGENIDFWTRYLGGGVSPRSATALDRFGLASLAHIPAGYLSAGQKRRLALARLLAAQRPIWLLDEPTVSLDAQSTQILSDIIREHVAADGLVIAATHIDLTLDANRLDLGKHIP